jgi:hypothetical protein
LKTLGANNLSSMLQFFKYLLIVVAGTLTASFSYCQNWTKQLLKARGDSVSAVYAWEEYNQFHGAGGEIILTRKGRYYYSAYHPLSFQEHSEGTFQIRKDTLCLTSDLQSDNLKVAVTYIDSTETDTSYTRLSLPLNSKGEKLYNTYYFINNDSSFNGHYDPLFPANLHPLPTLKSIKVMFYDTHWGSKWIPISDSDKFIQVTVLTDLNEADRTYKVINGWRFKMSGSNLIDLSNKKY